MVSIVHRSDYLSQCRLDPYLSAFVDFVQGNEIKFEIPKHLNNANDIALASLVSIQKEDKSKFIQAYTAINQRSPKKETDWLFNDLLLFCCLLGVKKFQVEDTWLRKSLKLRDSATNTEAKDVNETFWDVLNNNFDNKDNSQILMVVFKHHLNINQNPNDLNALYLDIQSSSFPLFKSNFLNIITLAALDIIVLNKNLTDIEEIQTLKRFRQAFQNRTSQLASLTWWLLFILMLLGSIYFSVFFIMASEENAKLIDRFLTVSPFWGFAGVTPVLLLKKKWIENKVKFILYSWFGFKDLDDDS